MNDGGDGNAIADPPKADPPSADPPSADPPSAETPSAETPSAETPIAETPIAAVEPPSLGAAEFCDLEDPLTLAVDTAVLEEDVTPENSQAQCLALMRDIERQELGHVNSLGAKPKIKPSKPEPEDNAEKAQEQPKKKAKKPTKTEKTEKEKTEKVEKGTKKKKSTRDEAKEKQEKKKPEAVEEVREEQNQEEVGLPPLDDNALKKKLASVSWLLTTGL